jgi:hypothetical protein
MERKKGNCYDTFVLQNKFLLISHKMKPKPTPDHLFHIIISYGIKRDEASSHHSSAGASLLFNDAIQYCMHRVQKLFFICLACSPEAPLISQLHHIIREHHEKVNACTTASDHNRFWGRSCRRLIVNYLFDVFGVLWNIETRFEFHVMCVRTRSQRTLLIFDNFYSPNTLRAFYINFAAEINLIISRNYAFPKTSQKASTRFNELFLGICRDVVLVVPTMMLTHIIKCD